MCSLAAQNMACEIVVRMRVAFEEHFLVENDEQQWDDTVVLRRSGTAGIHLVGAVPVLSGKREGVIGEQLAAASFEHR
jgi:hypothetical protein